MPSGDRGMSGACTSILQGLERRAGLRERQVGHRQVQRAERNVVDEGPAIHLFLGGITGSRMCDGRSASWYTVCLRHLDPGAGAEWLPRVRVAIELREVAAGHVDADAVPLPERDRRSHQIDLEPVQPAPASGGWAC